MERLSLTLEEKTDSKKTNVALIGDFKVSYQVEQDIRILYQEIFLEEAYHFISENPRPVIIDAGSNVGVSVLYFKHLFPQSQVIAFEANPFAFALLKQNIAQNLIDGVTLHWIALYDKKTTLPFFINFHTHSYAGSLKYGFGTKQKILVPSAPLSDYLSDWKGIDLIKLDIEGAEREVIRDLWMSGMLRKCKQYILEYHQIPGESNGFDELCQPFLENGFTRIILSEVEHDSKMKVVHVSFTRI